MRRYLFYFPLLFLMVSCEIIEEDISGRAVTTIAPADDADFTPIAQAIAGSISAYEAE